MHIEGRTRVVIEKVSPEIDNGRFPIKRIINEKVIVRADAFTEGHDEIKINLLYRKADEKNWKTKRMKSLGNDKWEGMFAVREIGIYHYCVEGGIDYFTTWQKDLKKSLEAGQEIRVKLLIGFDYLREAADKALDEDKEELEKLATDLRNHEDLERAVSLALSNDVTQLMLVYSEDKWMSRYSKTLLVIVDREKALFSTWYEFFPRSCSLEPGKHGTFKECERFLPDIKRMGFDVLYLPPIHPIGRTKRKGKNNSPKAESDDPGSPWAIGSEEGGHKSVHPALGTMEDFEAFVKKAAYYDLEVALDLAFQCSNNHPYVKEHPEWFLWRPDGTVQYAENPPKRYEDLIPFYFESDSWKELWDELKSIVLFWIQKDIRIFRVDNPHTKPFAFWEWLIQEIKRDYPDVLFLAEAFTRPKVMYWLAKLGFSQSYTYFAWRNTKREFEEYLKELLTTEIREYFRPNFWPNTPDILPEFLQYDGRSSFIIKVILAATLSSNYGIYGPAYELCINAGIPEKEEYLDSEKYEIKQWDLETPGHLRNLIARINRIRKENRALQTSWNLTFYPVDNENVLCYGKATEDLSNIILVVVNLDPFHTQSGRVKIPLDELDLVPEQSYLVFDLISDEKYIWQGESNYVELNPQIMPAYIFRVHRRLRREVDFDYYM